MNELERQHARAALAGRASTDARQPDAVIFTAPCPACGRECDWAAGRVDQHTVNHPLCDCRPGDATASSPAA